MVIKLVIIRRAKENEIERIAEILLEAFWNEIKLIVEDKNKALKLMPPIIKEIDGDKFVAEDDDKIIGVMLTSYSKIKLSLSTIFKGLRVLGIRGAMKAVRYVKSYLDSVPKKQDDEGMLEALAVAPEYSGIGLGDKLLQRAEDEFKEKGLKYSSLCVNLNWKALKLHEKRGHVKVAEFENKFGEWYYMKKEL